jgi:hypothetical protein
MQQVGLRRQEDGILWRRLTLPVEDRREPRPGYRWFRAENIVCIEHFRQPHRRGQKAGQFGWVDDVEG